MTPKRFRRFLTFNMNDPHWGGGGGGGEPPRRPAGDGPPDLDELWNNFWQDFNRRFGIGDGKGNGGGGMRPRRPVMPDGGGGKGAGAVGNLACRAMAHGQQVQARRIEPAASETGVRPPHVHSQKVHAYPSRTRSA